MRDGAYTIEFANLDDRLAYAGIVVLELGRFEGGYFGLHYAGRFSIDPASRFTGDCVVSRPGSAELRLVLIGLLEKNVVHGLAARLDDSRAIARFRLALRNGEG